MKIKYFSWIKDITNKDYEEINKIYLYNHYSTKRFSYLLVEGGFGGFSCVGVVGVLENDTGAVGVVGDVILAGLFQEVRRHFVRLF